MSNYNSINNNKYRFIISDGSIYYLNITTDINFSGEQAVIVYESATGDGGITINNGRLQESIPLSGFIVAQNNDDLLTKCDSLMKIKEEGESIDFITPFNRIRGDKGNKFHIKKLEFNATNSTPTSMPFVIELTEDRMLNVKTTSVNLVNYQTAEFMKRYYFDLVAN